MNRTIHGWEEFRCLVILEEISEYLSNFISSFTRYLIDTVEHLILACILYIIICIALYVCIVNMEFIPFTRDTRNAKRVLFVIAHPDDECMFFGPAILNYTKKKNCSVYLMCLTTEYLPPLLLAHDKRNTYCEIALDRATENGNHYGMGSKRKKELYSSCKILGIPEGNILIHNHTNLPDAMDVRWPTELVSQLVSNQVDSLNITTLITFDRYGVSRHCNHCCIYYGVANLILDRKLPKYCGVYVLESINTLRKYWFLLDIPLSLILSRFRFVNM
ncbi:hypothetical protein NQ315_013749 [Exocentrus adspersus]|uniref:N-acetylglucosaminylphosphatidylinositol deacetylase n=1 Tax=Exocentrus adspersus TaxID=1586481 RepID=A0AAV8W555_9CUCU|nr:hypothetical protein NQ315_013749 [Exocentrus adspersus]